MYVMNYYTAMKISDFKWHRIAVIKFYSIIFSEKESCGQDSVLETLYIVQKQQKAINTYII